VTLKVCIIPAYAKPDRGEGGIRRVCEAQAKYLPEFGIEVVADVGQADVVNTHGVEICPRPDVPVLNSSHGLMWSRYAWERWAHDINARVVEAMVVAQAHTAPSEWVANALRRSGLFYPTVVYHGVDPDEWIGGEPSDYILWNKARADLVSNPSDMNQAAERMRGRHFLSTIGKATPNVTIIGTTNVQTMRSLVAKAGVYLATARETFGIGTLEALSCGVPVAGWNWGGQSEIIIPGETGYLAEPGDYEGLEDAIERCFAERQRLSANCRGDVISRWTWRPRIAQYAELYHALNRSHDLLSRSPKVSVIVTNHNLEAFLPDALGSVARQSMTNFECIIVDDASTTNPVGHIAKFLEDKRFRLVQLHSNVGLASARNNGFLHTNGRYVINLDADDMLDPLALEALATELDKDPATHIAYGHLDVIGRDGSRRRNDWPFDKFEWWQQVGHLNQLPYAAMMRREVMERSGGYRHRQWRAEDAEFWVRVTSLGFRARKVTELSTLIYRDRNDSKSKSEPGDGDWTIWFPWRLAGSHTEARTTARDNIHGHVHPKPWTVPLSAQGQPPPGMISWDAHDFAEPFVSVVIPVGPGHEPYLVDALDSVAAQEYIDWECIVVNDTGKEWPAGFDSPVAGHPWARVVATEGKRGPARARNTGASIARGKALMWLDADDMLLPEALARMVEMYLGAEGVIYSDWLKSEGKPDIPVEYHETDEFDCEQPFVDAQGRFRKMQHSVTCLVPRKAHEATGGFDEMMTGWEDWDYFIALRAAGACFYRAPIAGFIYFFRSGKRREESWGSKPDLLRYMRGKWAEYIDGRKTMPGCGGGCGGKTYTRAPLPPPSRSARAAVAPPPGVYAEAVLLRYVGPGQGRVTLIGTQSGTPYRFEVNGEARWVHRDDVADFMDRSTHGKPWFVQVALQAPEKQAPTLQPAQAELPKVKAEFPAMPEAKPPEPVLEHSLKGMNAETALAAIATADLETLLQYREQEMTGRKRKSVMAEINKALSNAHT